MADSSLVVEPFGTFVCPACAGHEFPDEVGLHRCECGATTEVYVIGAGEGSRPSSPVAPDGPEQSRCSRCTCGSTDPCWECCDK